MLLPCIPAVNKKMAAGTKKGSVGTQKNQEHPGKVLYIICHCLGRAEVSVDILQPAELRKVVTATE